jgi:hypothetical protein
METLRLFVFVVSALVSVTALFVLCLLLRRASALADDAAFTDSVKCRDCGTSLSVTLVAAPPER